MPWRKHALEFAEGIRGKDPGAHARGSSIDPIAARGGRAFHRLRRPAHSRYLSSRRNLLRRAKRRFALWNNAEITPPSNSNHFCYGTQQRIRLTLTMLKIGTGIPPPQFEPSQNPYQRFHATKTPSGNSASGVIAMVCSLSVRLLGVTGLG
jgi:hypothetical protein